LVLLVLPVLILVFSRRRPITDHYAAAEPAT
jgi:hypothetical protein